MSVQDTPKAPASANEPEDLAFRLLSIRASSAPRDSAGRDWHEYRIGQGANVIKGYRRGDPQTVRADVEKIVIGLNERRRSFKAPSTPKRGGQAAAAPRVEPQHHDE
ncbi:MAG TPA: hypothetical protein VMV37_10415 [Gammaproteobacteria bacterium]|nr:hypothetical protein [Gammaproteobacteria bacterium]